MRVLSFFLILIILCTLGIWQLQRKAYKDKLSLVTQQENVDVVTDPSKLPSHLNQDVGVRGVLQYDKAIFLYHLNNNVPGYLVLVPLKYDTQLLLIDLGWVKDKQTLPVSQADVEIVGYLAEFYALPNWMVSKDYSDGVWFRLDQEKLKQYFGQNVMPLLLIASDHLVGEQHFTKIFVANNHLYYAMMWFALAVSWFFIGGCYFFSNLRVRS